MKIGDTYEDLSIIGFCDYYTKSGNKKLGVKCLCKCGRQVVKEKATVSRGFTKSCGCKKANYMRNKQTKHGLSGTRTYGAWQKMVNSAKKQVCYIDPKWEDYEVFLKDMGEAPEEKNLNRKDVLAPFNKKNCHWGDGKQRFRGWKAIAKGRLKSLARAEKLILDTIDPVNKKYGRLYVTGWSGTGYGGKYHYVCSCGGEGWIKRATLLAKPAQPIEYQGCSKHCHRDNSLRQIWNSMKQRCYNKNAVNYEAYGGRGVIVCQEWIDSYDTFYKDVGVRPSKKHSLDRIDNDKGYCKENVRWATRHEQAVNRRGAHYLEKGLPKGIREIKNKHSVKYLVLVQNNDIKYRGGTYVTLDEAKQALRELVEREGLNKEYFKRSYEEGM